MWTFGRTHLRPPRKVGPIIVSCTPHPLDICSVLPRKVAGHTPGASPFATGKLTCMKWICLVLGILTLLVTASAQKPKKVPDIEVLEAKAHRGEDKISLDGRVKISGEKPLKGLILAFDF